VSNYFAFLIMIKVNINFKYTTSGGYRDHDYIFYTEKAYDAWWTKQCKDHTRRKAIGIIEHINTKKEDMKNKIFLGGTCGDSTWREEIIEALHPSILYFNPVVSDWTPECQAQEEEEKNQQCNIHLYVITSEMKGVFSIAEVVDSAYKRDKITILQVLSKDFDKHQLKSLQATCDLVKRVGGIAFIDDNLGRVLPILNNI